MLTLVPLILVTSALSAGILRRRWEKLETLTGTERVRTLRVDLLLGWGMCVAAIGAELLALTELKFRTNSLDWPLYVATFIVTVGLGVALFATIGRALRSGVFPKADVGAVDASLAPVPEAEGR